MGTSNDESFPVYRGIFVDNCIICEDGTLVETTSYGIVKEKIEGKNGFFHLKEVDNIGFIIFSYILDNEENPLV